LLLPDGTACAIDACMVVVVLVRRDVMIEVWSDLWAGEFGVKASDEVCLGVLEGCGLCHVLGGSVGLFLDSCSVTNLQ